MWDSSSPASVAVAFIGSPRVVARPEALGESQERRTLLRILAPLEIPGEPTVHVGANRRLWLFHKYSLSRATLSKKQRSTICRWIVHPLWGTDVWRTSTVRSPGQMYEKLLLYEPLVAHFRLSNESSKSASSHLLTPSSVMTNRFSQSTACRSWVGFCCALRLPPLTNISKDRCKAAVNQFEVLRRTALQLLNVFGASSTPRNNFKL